MSEQTSIAWCDSTFNPWIGCQKVGPGCDHCYAEREFEHRHHRAKWGPGQERVRTSAHNWRQPMRWNAKPFYECPECGWRGAGPVAHSQKEGRIICPTFDCIGTPAPARRRVFCGSLCDVFDNAVPAQWRADLFALIEKTPNVDWLILTKRIGNAVQMMMESCGFSEPNVGSYTPRQNVWLGATICNQEEADRDIQKLLAVPAAVRFISMEPLLGAVDLNHIDPIEGPVFSALSAALRKESTGEVWDRPAIDWVIVGGESGPKARPTHPDWVRSLRDQCGAAGVPFMFKQWGEWAPEDCHGLGRADTGPRHRYDFGGVLVDRVGKKAAGRMIDFLEWNEFPGVTP